MARFHSAFSPLEDLHFPLRNGRGEIDVLSLFRFTTSQESKHVYTLYTKTIMHIVYFPPPPPLSSISLARAVIPKGNWKQWFCNFFLFLRGGGVDKVPFGGLSGSGACGFLRMYSSQFFIIIFIITVYLTQEWKNSFPCVLL